MMCIHKLAPEICILREIIFCAILVVINCNSIASFGQMNTSNEICQWFLRMRFSAWRTYFMPHHQPSPPCRRRSAKCWRRIYTFNCYIRSFVLRCIEPSPPDPLISTVTTGPRTLVIKSDSICWFAAIGNSSPSYGHINGLLHA